MKLHDSVNTLKGVGNVTARNLERLGIYTILDLISYYPKRYEDRTRIFNISDLEPGIQACIFAKVENAPSVFYRSGKQSVERCILSDGSGRIRAVWFNQPWLKDSLKAGSLYYFFGTVSVFNGVFTLNSPSFEAEDETPRNTRRILPVYTLTNGIRFRKLQDLILQSINECISDLQTALPCSVIPVDYPKYSDAIREIHFPTELHHLNSARNRIIFEDFFLYSFGMALLHSETSIPSPFPCQLGIPAWFRDSLPYALTASQEAVMDEIQSTLLSGKKLVRLVQGDVGSGKTTVAAAAMFMVVGNGYQAALMAPTELLAQQHFETLSSFCRERKITACLITGSISLSEKKQRAELVSSGAAKIIVGTHALISSTLSFNNLGLVVIDEQQRFGVAQRSALSAKGLNPHMLFLTATPIPRTLALCLYGDIEVSEMKELPPGRVPISTHLVTSEYFPRLLQFIRKQYELGYQTYIVCPSISGENESESTEYITKYIRQELPDISSDVLHGQLPNSEKDAVMQRFQHGDIRILISTTVVEVGVDVPNATLMIIIGADRFGLAQLHQLRGRVGRSKIQSYCVLVSDTQLSETKTRLKAFCDTNNGYQIAMQDLAERGAGDFLGTNQSGDFLYSSAMLNPSLSVIKQARDAAYLYAKNKSAPEYAALDKYVRDRFFTSDLSLS